MDIFRNPYSDDTNNLSQTARSILIGVALFILLVMAAIIYFYYLGGLKTEIIMGVGIVPILASLELARKNQVQSISRWQTIQPQVHNEPTCL